MAAGRRRRSRRRRVPEEAEKVMAAGRRRRSRRRRRVLEEVTAARRRRRRTEKVTADIILEPGNATTGVGKFERKENMRRIREAFKAALNRNVSQKQAEKWLIEMGGTPPFRDIRLIKQA